MSEVFHPISPQVSLPAVEERILEYWRRHGIVEKGLALNEGAEEWVFYEGPPTANAKPHVGNVETQVFKDIFPRFQAMRGRYVHRKAGWDCHGLPVELEIEKELGLTSKRQIEEYGIQRFNERCRASVQRYVEEWEWVSERVAFWINIRDAYWTMSADFVESVWWSLKRLHGAGLLFQDYRSAPYCPRCETVLSDHEQNQPEAYKTVRDPSVYVRLPLIDDDADLLIWTTTPWTLPSNLAAAVHPDVRYASVVVDGGRPVILAESLVEQVVGQGGQILETFDARRLEGRRYKPPYEFVKPNKPAWFVIPEDFVSMEDGTGIVHIAPAFGAEDMEAGRRHDLPFVNLVDPSGHFVAEAGPFSGMFIKDADKNIASDLKGRGLLFREETYEHNYPHCWRCKTPLLYYGTTSWYVRTTSQKAELLEQNEKTNWYPAHIKHGRYGQWLRNNVDWALSRNRYWGTPLPIWRCSSHHDTVIGSRSELSDLTGTDLSALDPHRPFVDKVSFPCPKCGEISLRLPEVIDVWYDSGSMPFAQWGYPHKGEELFKERFPADFIAEALDQTRGWFYSLMAVSTLLFGESSYRNALCLGLFLDEEARKMSKSIGNVIDPWDIINRYGADALRWFMFTSGSPWANRRLGPTVIEDLMRRYLLTLWNTYSFFVTYANIDGFDPDSWPDPKVQRPDLDRWILSELNDCIREVAHALDSYDALRGGRRLNKFVDDLSNWYVRRSRGRFWKSESDVDKISAYRTLHECLVKVAKTTAPFTPFIAEEIFINLTNHESVHLRGWPSVDESLIDKALMESMRVARIIASLGRAARSEANVRTRQPLQKALLVAPAGEREGLARVIHLVAEELNVKALEFVESLDSFVDYAVKPNFRTLGPRFGSAVEELAQVIYSTDALDVRRQLEETGRARFVNRGAEVWLGSDDLEIRAEGRKGYAVAHDSAYGVALDVEITPDLRKEGLAREVARALNEARRQNGFEIAERVHLYAEAHDELAEVLNSWRDWIAGEILVLEWLDSPPLNESVREIDIDGSKLRFALVRLQ